MAGYAVTNAFKTRETFSGEFVFNGGDLLDKGNQ